MEAPCSLFTLDSLESAAAIVPRGAATGEALLYTIVEQFANALNSLLDNSLETPLGRCQERPSR